MMVFNILLLAICLSDLLLTGYSVWKNRDKPAKMRKMTPEERIKQEKAQRDYINFMTYTGDKQE